MSRRAAALFALALCACERPPEIALDIRLPEERRLLRTVTRLELRAERDGRVLAQRSFPSTATWVGLEGVSHGPRTVFTLEGVVGQSDVVGYGRSCPVDFHGPGQRVHLYFAPSTFFAPTPAPPLVERIAPVALALADGTVLVAGGQTGGAATEAAERFAPGSATFADAPERALDGPRSHAALAEVPGIGAIVVGGLGEGGRALATADVYLAASGVFLPVDAVTLGARVGHRAVTLPDGRVLVTGGGPVPGGAPLATTAVIDVQEDGSAAITRGPDLAEARRDHAAVVAGDRAIVIGGYGTTGAPLATLEALFPDGTFSPIASLRHARAEATATVLDNGSILVVGGAGDESGTPRADAELFDPYTRTTTVFAVAPRKGHTATPLGQSRVLIAGGVGPDGQPLTSAELYTPSTGFVSARPLTTPRAGHVAIALCDGTVLVVGGGPGAEIYTPRPR